MGLGRGSLKWMGVVAVVAGCDAEDGTAEMSAADGSIFETSEPVDAAQVDTAPASLCALGCTPISVEGAPYGVTFAQPEDGRTSLAGGEAPDGVWNLRATEVYASGAFVDGIAVTFGNAGETAGRAIFGGDAMALVLDLHLDVTVDVFGTSGSGIGRGKVELGGCYERVSGELRGALGTCASGFPEGTAPPESVGFEFAGGDAPLRIGVTLSQGTLISLLPPDQQAAASAVIVGPMYLVATFERP
jgi:hypothetical protein